MPAPPARMRSARVPCGLNSSSSSLREILPLEFLVLADVGGNHFADLTALQQQPETGAVDAGVVRHDGQIANARIVQRADQLLGNAAQAETAAHQRDAVLDDAAQGARRIRIHLGARGHRPISIRITPGGRLFQMRQAAARARHERHRMSASTITPKPSSVRTPSRCKSPGWAKTTCLAGDDPSG